MTECQKGGRMPHQSLRPFRQLRYVCYVRCAAYVACVALDGNLASIGEYRCVIVLLALH